MKKKKSFQRSYVYAACLTLGLVAALAYYYMFTSMIPSGESKFVYVDNDDNIDSVYTKLATVCNSHSMTAFRTLARHSNYAHNIRTGRYEIKPGNGAFKVFRNMKLGRQTAVNITIPSVRTPEKLAEALSEKLMASKQDILHALQDSATCAEYGRTPKTMLCMFIPNTYNVYWNCGIDEFLNKMDKEQKRFWNIERKNKAKAMNLTEEEVITLASIVEEETANDGEKPMIAGMYYNRLKADMPLQADPTIKFALKKFELKRIYNDMLSVNSPYNTYRNKGLPPGPIRIPTVKGIDAVLNYVHHNYMYMCAKEDFSGTHNFAVTYDEHLKNAAKYTKALNDKNIN